MTATIFARNTHLFMVFRIKLTWIFFIITPSSSFLARKILSRQFEIENNPCWLLQYILLQYILYISAKVFLHIIVVHRLHLLMVAHLGTLPLNLGAFRSCWDFFRGKIFLGVFWGDFSKSSWRLLEKNFKFWQSIFLV